jgi:hypothetical protein
MPSASRDPAARISQLERELQHIRAVAVAVVLLLLALVLSGFNPSGEPVVRAERLELVSSTGVRQAIISADTSGFDLMLLDQRGRPSGRLRLTDEPWLSVQTGRGDEAAGLGAPKPHHLTD